MVADDRHFAVALDGRDGCGQLARTNEEIEHEPRLAHPGDSSLDVVVEQPLGIGLVVDLVADADELLAAGHREQRVKRGFDVGGRQIDPAHDPVYNPCSDASLRR